MSPFLGRVKAVLLFELLPPLSERSRRRVKTAFRWSMWALLALVILGVVTWGLMNWIGDRQLRRTLADLQAAGYPVHLADCAPPPVPVEDNAAPYYSAAFALLSMPRAGEEQQALEKVPQEGVEEIPGPQEALLRVWIDRNRDAFDLVRSARMKGHCQFDRKYEGYETRFPELAGLSRMVQALSIRARLEACSGRLERARESVEDILRLARAVADDPSIICQMIRLNALNWALVAVNGCVDGRTDAESLGRWLALLPRDSDLEGCMERPLRAELATLAESIPLPSSVLFDMKGALDSPGGRREDDLGGIILTRLSYPIQRRDGARCLGLLRQAADLSRKPYVDHQAEWLALQEEVGGSSPYFNTIIRLIMPGLPGLAKVQARCQSHIVVTRTGLEWELEYQTRGGYPEQVSARDPWTGQKLGYDAKSSSLFSDEAHYRPDRGVYDRAWTLRHPR